MATASTVWASEEAEGPFSVEELVRDVLAEHVGNTKVVGLDVYGREDGKDVGHDIVEVALVDIDVEAAKELLVESGLRAWSTCVTYWQRSTKARVRRKLAGGEDEVVTVVPHGTINGMVRIDIYGAFEEETFHLLDDQPLWTEEPSPCSCAHGCKSCARFRALPPPSYGFSGAGGP